MTAPTPDTPPRPTPPPDAARTAAALMQADILAERIHRLYVERVQAHRRDVAEQGTIDGHGDPITWQPFADAPEWHRTAMRETALALLRGER